MKRLYVSQRVDVIAGYNERRDALDQRWASFLWETGALACPLPNNPEPVLEMLKQNPPDGILLTGGNSPVKYGGNAPERDMVDAILLDFAAKHRIPLIGVCRGTQSVLLHFGGSLREIESHIAVRHMVAGQISRQVNSYHGLSADVIPANIEILAHSEDGAIEAVRHTSLPIVAMMWHPERENVFEAADVDLFHKVWYEKADMI